MAANTSYSLSSISALTDSDKKRLIAALLCHKDRNNVDWDAATALVGAKTKHSFKVTYYAAMKKLANGAADGGGSTSETTTPKRKRTADAEDKPTPKRSGRASKAIKTEAEEPEPRLGPVVKAEDAAPEEEPELDPGSFFATEEI
ncbi:uncharacterized protein BKCO1_3600044 [Diplodia corticola]|uniref:Myb-like domain-containing protein n=1 Tax=Diplodia corticola TaxID=236234 RepID=A0A1J9RJP0_9PEZI|nr:uncharacterized protein BKCO1_3600044 [Diplodia corticola]OJD32787.1 hypothetical protein BKCO1_3600044 [Diplodia corticola]